MSRNFFGLHTSPSIDEHTEFEDVGEHTIASSILHEKPVPSVRISETHIVDDSFSGIDDGHNSQNAVPVDFSESESHTTLSDRRFSSDVDDYSSATPILASNTKQLKNTAEQQEVVSESGMVYIKRCYFPNREQCKTG